MANRAVLMGKHEILWWEYDLSSTSKTEKVSICVCFLWCLWGLWAYFCTARSWKPVTLLWVSSKAVLELLLYPSLGSSFFFWCQLVHSSPGNSSEPGTLQMLMAWLHTFSWSLSYAKKLSLCVLWVGKSRIIHYSTVIVWFMSQFYSSCWSLNPMG